MDCIWTWWGISGKLQNVDPECKIVFFRNLWFCNTTQHCNRTFSYVAKERNPWFYKPDMVRLVMRLFSMHPSVSVVSPLPNRRIHPSVKGHACLVYCPCSQLNTLQTLRTLKLLKAFFKHKMRNERVATSFKSLMMPSCWWQWWPEALCFWVGCPSVHVSVHPSVHSCEHDISGTLQGISSYLTQMLN